MALHCLAAVVAVVLVSCLLAPEASSLNISTYWGTNLEEGKLADACATNLYGIVNIGFVDKFGSDSNPTLNLTGHCDPTLHGCKHLGQEIQKCQDLGIKVLISIGGPGRDYKLTSQKDTRKFADYLWYSYLGGRNLSYDRPFGVDVNLDGVDFFIAAGTIHYWDVLAKALKNHSTNGTHIELSATAKCKYPDNHLNTAIQTGIFDYVQVRFYSESECQGNFETMEGAWDEWTYSVPVDKIFAGVTAFQGEEGYVDPTKFTSGFLEYAKGTQNFGGAMVWNVDSDRSSGYSEALINSTN